MAISNQNLAIVVVVESLEMKSPSEPFNDLMYVKRMMLYNYHTLENLRVEHDRKQLQCLKLFKKGKVSKQAPHFTIKEVEKKFVAWRKVVEKTMGKKYADKVHKKSVPVMYKEIVFKKLKGFQGRKALRTRIGDK